MKLTRSQQSDLMKPDDLGRINLTNLWKACNDTSKRSPGAWKIQKESAAFILHIASKELGVNYTNLCSLKNGAQRIFFAKQGKMGATLAHPVIALAYAKYLSHDLHELVNRTFFERIEEERNPEKIADRYVRTLKRQGMSDAQIAARLETKASRVRFTGVLAAHNVKGDGYRLCTNATYTPLWGGGAEMVRQKVGAKPGENPRNHMSILQLRSVEMAELLAAEVIEANDIRGNAQCAAECTRAAVGVREMLMKHREKILPQRVK